MVVVMETRLENKESGKVRMRTVPSEAPFVSIVIPCRNEAGMIERCLQSVLRQEPPPGGMEIIVADGMSEDGTREVLARLEKEVSGLVVNSPVLRVIDNPGRIVSTGLNAAIRAAKGDLIIRMDAHTEFAPDYVRQCVALMQKTGADNVGGPARTKPKTCLERAIAAAYHSPFSVGGARFHDPDYEGFVDTVTYGCWRKETFQRFGCFDEELVRNQDDEHNLRIVRGGGKIWQSPEIKSWYRPRGSLRELFKQYMQYGYWKVRVIQKHKLPGSIRHLVPGTFVLGLTLLFLLSVFSFLLFTFAPNSQLSALSIPISIFRLQVSAFSLFFLAALGSYLFAVLAASLLAAWRSGWNLLPLLPLVFPCYHFGYAYGFLCGIWDFVIRGRSPNRKFKLLTR